MKTMRLCTRFIIILIILISITTINMLRKNAQLSKEIVQSTTQTTTKCTTTVQSTTTTTTKKTTKKVVKKSTKKYYITPPTTNEIKSYLHQMVLAYGWTEEDYNKALYIMEHESMNPNSRINSYDAPCGLAQANPCRKVPEQYRKDWKYQVRWFLDYIKNNKKYGTVDKAYRYKRKHGNY